MSDEIFQASPEIELRMKDGYAVLAITREAKRNAMSRSARQGMLRALEHAKGRFPVIVLTGIGRSFCSGIDVKERAEDIENGIHTSRQEWTDTILAVRSHPAVFVAAVNGTAVGGGLTLINVCDLAVAAEDIEMGMPELGFGNYAGLAGPSTQMVLCRKRVSWMLLTTKRINATLAEEWGIINKCVPRDQLMSTAEEIAGDIAKFEPTALTAVKHALDQIPAAITDWRQAFQYGEYANAFIMQRTGITNPFKDLPQSRSSNAAAPVGEKP